MKHTLLLVVLSGGAPLLMPTPPAHSQTIAAVGIKLPPGNQSYDRDTAPFATILQRLAQDEDIHRKPTGAPAQVWIWQGDNYDAQAAQTLKMKVQGAMTAAGFGVQSTSGMSERINIFDFFDASDPNVAFRPRPAPPPSYFSLNNPESGDAFVAVLAESEKSLVLALLPVIGEKKPSAAKSNPLRNARYVSDGTDALKGTVGVSPTFYPLDVKAGMLRGEVKNVGGIPVVGATVSVRTWASGVFTPQHSGRSNAQGVYEVPVPKGVSRVSAAWCHVKYNGLTYALPLQSADGQLDQFNHQRGHTENFVLPIDGKANPNGSPSDFKSYYGGSIRLSHSNAISQGGTFELVLMPQGALINGNIGVPLVYRAPNDGNDVVLNNIPLGRYKASVNLINAEGTTPLQLEKFSTGKRGAAITVDFEPLTSNKPQFGSCPVRQFRISLHP